ncbi:alpha-farnesene synthase-like [Vicia villosa]|uniref:alpha-farnesene synthase-like n=1 Tax=Vicia villosa TaxID=3911 RepID=UPI00273ACEEC|nr:alpha-farnesene synthase-like [Vicia villosa]
MTNGSRMNQSDLRRSANYRPNIWKDNFLQSLASKYDKEEYALQLNKWVIEVKFIFVQDLDFMQKIELVDWIQKLGLANHFEKEIDEFLQTIFVSAQNFNKLSEQENMHVSTLCFRLLRQHGYDVFPTDILSNLLDVRDNSFASDAKDIIELLEATHLGIDGEKVLDDTKTFAIKWLKDAARNKELIPKHVIERVAHALELPSHWRVPWFDVKWHVKQYQSKMHMDPVLLELSKLNFNITQAKLQKEVKELSRWWEKLDLKKVMVFARNRLVESFMCAAGVASEAKYRSLRKWLTKVIIFVLMIDDIYDIHASFEQLVPFTMAFQRWDAKKLDEQLPEYMKICFNALQDVTNEIAYEVGGEKNFNMVLQCLKNTWIEFCKALFMEAKWYKMGYIPSLREYLSNASITSSGPLILMHSYFSTMHELTDEIVDFSHTYQDLVYNVSLIIRLCNDLATAEAERERGDAASSIACYMNEMNVSEEKARKHIQDIINSAWKKINGHCSTQNVLMEPFFNQARNAARMAHTLYLNGDGFGIQDRDIKKHILSLVVEPF